MGEILDKSLLVAISGQCRRTAFVCLTVADAYPPNKHERINARGNNNPTRLFKRIFLFSILHDPSFHGLLPLVSQFFQISSNRMIGIIASMKRNRPREAIYIEIN